MGPKCIFLRYEFTAAGLLVQPVHLVPFHRQMLPPRACHVAQEPFPLFLVPQHVAIVQVAPMLLAWAAAHAATAQLANIPLPQQLSTLPPA